MDPSRVVGRLVVAVSDGLQLEGAVFDVEVTGGAGVELAGYHGEQGRLLFSWCVVFAGRSLAGARAFCGPGARRRVEHRRDLASSRARRDRVRVALGI